MADIDVQRREGAPMWLWLVGAALLALLIWVIFAMTGRDDRQVGMVEDTTFAAAETTPMAPAEPMGAVPAAVTEYLSECRLEEGARPDAMGMDHEFAINCFERLANSIDAISQQRTPEAGVSQNVDVIRQNVQRLRDSEPTSTQHANYTREAAEAGATALETMHRSWHAGDAQLQGSVTEVRSAAQAIATAQPQLEQRGDLRIYFARAGDALNNLAMAR